MEYTVDRIESGIAVLEGIENGDVISIELSCIEGAKEGDIVRFDDGVYTVLVDETAQLKLSIRERFDRLKNKR